MAHKNRPDLEKRQVAWQNWRNRQYSDLQEEGRFVENNRRSNNNKQGTRYAEHDNDLLARETEALDDSSGRYHSKIVPMDTRLKRACYEGATEEWEAALNEAEQLMGK